MRRLYGSLLTFSLLLPAPAFAADPEILPGSPANLPKYTLCKKNEDIFATYNREQTSPGSEGFVDMEGRDVGPVLAKNIVSLCTTKVGGALIVRYGSKTKTLIEHLYPRDGAYSFFDEIDNGEGSGEHQLCFRRGNSFFSFRVYYRADVGASFGGALNGKGQSESNFGTSYTRDYIGADGKLYRNYNDLRDLYRTSKFKSPFSVLIVQNGIASEGVPYDPNYDDPYYDIQRRYCGGY